MPNKVRTLVVLMLVVFSTALVSKPARAWHGMLTVSKNDCVVSTVKIDIVPDSQIVSATLRIDGPNGQLEIVDLKATGLRSVQKSWAPGETWKKYTLNIQWNTGEKGYDQKIVSRPENCEACCIAIDAPAQMYVNETYTVTARGTNAKAYRFVINGTVVQEGLQAEYSFTPNATGNYAIKVYVQGADGQWVSAQICEKMIIVIERPGTSAEVTCDNEAGVITLRFNAAYWQIGAWVHHIKWSVTTPGLIAPTPAAAIGEDKEFHYYAPGNAKEYVATTPLYGGLPHTINAESCIEVGDQSWCSPFRGTCARPTALDPGEEPILPPAEVVAEVFLPLVVR